MTGPTDAGASMRFSTEDLPERDRVAAFQDIYAQSIIRHDIDPLPDSPLHFSATFHALPGVTVASGVCSALHATRTPRHIDNDDIVLNVSLTGGRVLRQRDREALVRPGEAVLAASADVGVASVLERSEFISLRFPFSSIAPLLAQLDDAFVRTVPHNLHALQMLVGYVRLMDRDFAGATPELRRLSAAHIQDLTALAIGATRDATEIARGRAIRAARLLSIKRDIAENIGRRDLSAESVGARHGISASYVRKLFEADGTSFTEFVLSQRVARAHRMLSNPRFAARAISAIAFDVGFSDLSYFNRVFRRHYGGTPSDVRGKS